MEQHISPNHSSCRLYHGAPKESLPAYLLERLNGFFARAEELHRMEINTGVAPTWFVSIDPTPQISSVRGTAYEWVDFMVDHHSDLESVRSFRPEKYGYSDGIVEYSVRVINRSDRCTDYRVATELFSILAQDEQLFVHGPREEVARMMSYDIERAYRML